MNQNKDLPPSPRWIPPYTHRNTPSVRLSLLHHDGISEDLRGVPFFLKDPFLMARSLNATTLFLIVALLLVLLVTFFWSNFELHVKQAHSKQYRLKRTTLLSRDVPPHHVTEASHASPVQESFHGETISQISISPLFSHVFRDVLLRRISPKFQLHAYNDSEKPSFFFGVTAQSDRAVLLKHKSFAVVILTGRDGKREVHARAV